MQKHVPRLSELAILIRDPVALGVDIWWLRASDRRFMLVGRIKKGTLDVASFLQNHQSAKYAE
jgi:hypothetical protein